MNPILSIILPVYNTEAYFPACLESLVPQLDERAELIIVDDGCTDGSRAIARIFAYRYPELIHLISQENRGNTIARYTGLHSARGRYIAFMDSDDLADPAWYSSILSVIEQNEPDMIILRWQKFDDDGNLFETDRPPLFAEGPVKKEDVLKVYLSSQRVTGLPIKVVKRSLFTDETDYSDKGKRRLMEDKLISMQLFANAETFWHIPKVLYWYRTNLSSITIRKHPKEHWTLAYTYPPLFDFLKESGNDSEAFRDILVENYASVMWEILLKLHRTQLKKTNLQDYEEIRSFPVTAMIPERISRFTLADYKIKGIELLLNQEYKALYSYVGKIRSNPDLDHMPHLRKLGKLK